MSFKEFTLVPQLDHSPRLVAFAQTAPGKLTLVALFAPLLFLHGISLWWLISIYLVAFSLWPGRRWQILLAATWSFLLVGPTDFHWERISELLRGADIPWQINSTSQGLPLILMATICAGFYEWIVRSSPLSRHLKRPILTLICLFIGLMLCASYAPLPTPFRASLWVFLVIFGKYFWFLCYSLKECRSPNPVPILLQFGHYLPFWQPSAIPYPKGSGYLKKIEAKSSEEFAICQLKGLKLLIWALWLSFFALLINVTVYGYDDLLFGRLQFKKSLDTIQLFFDDRYCWETFSLPTYSTLPRYEVAFQRAAIGNPFPWYLNGSLLVIQFLYDLLHVAFTSHIVIAIIRMCGFNALRNTYRPLASKNIAEFWNRYFYYFKELLVEFFFYPSFFRYFKKRPVLRMYCATMAAAFLGNFLFHLLRDIWFIVDLGFFHAVGAFHVYFFYSFLLGNMIFFSQWRQDKVGPVAKGPVSRILTPVRVLGFYCLLTIFVDFRRESIADNIAFLLSLSPF